MTISISKQTARRYVLGKQGLWPGRRWRGKADLLLALESIEAVQEDPLNIGARSHDLALASRVLDYRPEHLEELLYHDRQALEYGGALFIYPMRELPYWGLHMGRRGIERRFGAMLAQDPGLLDHVRGEIERRGPLGNKDFGGAQRIANHYRGSKDTSLALYHLWLTGELLMSHRVNFQRKYDLRDRLAPPEHNWRAPDDLAEAYLALKKIAFPGLIRQNAWRIQWSGGIHRPVSHEEAAARVAALEEQGQVAKVRIEGAKDEWLILADDTSILEKLAQGDLPKGWQSLETTTEDEVSILAPLDIVGARGRAKFLFEFDYLWEVYKPVAQRQWGYYVLPVLYGDRLVARIEPRLDRATRTMQVLGYWHEAGEGLTSEYGDALARGIARLAELMRAERIALNGALPGPLQTHVSERLTRLFPRSSTTVPPT